MQYRVLVADPIAQDGLDILRREADVAVQTGLSAADLLVAVAGVDALVVRSETRVTAEVLTAGKQLKVVARAGVGVDNVDVAAATRLGIVVVNAPTGNTIAAAEHTIALMMALARHLPQAHASLSHGEWKRSRFVGVELNGKVLGIIGLGKVGAEVARRAQALGMETIAVDPYLSAERATALGVHCVDMHGLLASADFITIHVPLNAATGGLIGAAELAEAKSGVRILNVSRGGVVDEAALLAALDSGHVAGAALDVFAIEPADSGNPLLAHDKVIATPHLGASTIEAQRNVAVDVAEQILDIFHGRPAKYAVNAPVLLPEDQEALAPYLVVADRLGRFYAQVEGGTMDVVDLTYSGEIGEHDTAAVRAALLRGLLEPVCEETVNLVNAGLIAAGRGIRLVEHREFPDDTFGNLITVRIGESSLAGAFMHGQPHIVGIDSVPIDLEPRGVLLVARCHDRPGLLGRIGTVLGDSGVSINSAQFSRPGANGYSIAVLGLDDPAGPAVLGLVGEVPGVSHVRQAIL